MPGTRRLTMIPLGRYATEAGERELVLTDLVSRDGLWTLFDVYVDAEFVLTDARVVATALYNYADSGIVADAYLERSAALGYPAVDDGFDEWDVPVPGDLRERLREVRAA